MQMKIDVSLFQKNDDKQQVWNAFLLANANPEQSQIQNVRYGVVHFDAFAHRTPLVIMFQKKKTFFIPSMISSNKSKRKARSLKFRI